MGQANAVGPTSIEGRLFSSWVTCLVGGHAVDDGQLAAAGLSVLADDEVVAGVDAAVVVEPGDGGRWTTADDARQRHLVAVAS